MVSAAFLIYSGIMPLIKTFIAIVCGYVLARMDLFPPAASRGASQVTMNISLPALIFSSVVPAFTPSNVSALGPLFLTAFSYLVIGFFLGLVIREVCYVPRNFWQGIVILAGMSNWGNLPNAVVMSVTQQAPFDPTTDPALGVSFVSIFIVSYHLVFWVCGAAHSLSWDYLPGIPQGEEAERSVPWKEKPIGALVARYILGEKPASREPSVSASTVTKKDADSMMIEGKEKIRDVEVAVPQIGPQYLACGHPDPDPDVQLARRTSRLSTSPSYRSRRPSVAPIASTSVVPPPPPPSPIPSTLSTEVASEHHPDVSFPQRMLHVFRPLTAIVTPITLTLAISLPMALIQPLKALFVDVSATGGPDWKGPDGRPPLAFIIDTADFLGSIAVPLALILLGASFARLKIPRPISRLPIMAMMLVTLAKMVILPVAGVFIVQAMVHGGLIDKDAKAEKFVAMFLSGTPAAVNQMIVASLYSPDGNVDTLSAFLLVQYVFMFFSSAALTAVALLLL